MANGIYRGFAVSPVTDAQYKAAQTALQSVDLKGITSLATGYDPATSTMTIEVGIDLEELPDGVTAADLRTRVRTFFQNRFGKLPDVDVSRVAGEACMTGRDRGRQFIQALADGIDPRTIGIEAPVDTKEARIEVLRKYAAASKAHWNL